MFLTKPILIKKTPYVTFEQEVLERGVNGLFRAPLEQAAKLMPSMAQLLDTVPVKDIENWEVDIKVHMLFKDQYPCIPNWHCDNVPRVDGKVDYKAINYDSQPMYLWISDGPETEFLANAQMIDRTPRGHDELAKFIREGGYTTESIQPKGWYSIFQDTPHRGTASKKNGWRVFARLTHRSIAPTRPVTSFIRRHSQVYLNTRTFSW